MSSCREDDEPQLQQEQTDRQRDSHHFGILLDVMQLREYFVDESMLEKEEEAQLAVSSFFVTSNCRARE